MNTPANQPPVGAPPGAGGEGGGQNGGGGQGDGGNPPPNPKPDEQTVRYETHRQLLDEKKKVQTERDALAARVAELERKEAEKNGDYQKLLQLANEEKERLARLNDELSAKVTTIETQHTQVRKLAAIVKAAGGSVDAKWHDLLADKFLPDVVVHPETGEIDQGSVTKAVEKLRATFPEVISGKPPGVPNGDPGAGGAGQPGTIRRAEWLKLPYAEMTKWKPQQIVD